MLFFLKCLRSLSSSSSFTRIKVTRQRIVQGLNLQTKCFGDSKYKKLSRDEGSNIDDSLSSLPNVEAITQDLQQSMR